MIYQFENCSLDTVRRELRCNGDLRSVEPQVFDLLQFLIENRESVVSRDDIFRTVWRGRIVSDSVLSTRVNAARQAVNDDGTQQRLIRTLRRNGFRFVGTVYENKRATALAQPAVSTKHRLAFSLNGAPTVAVLPFTCIDDNGKGGPFAEGLAEEITCALYKLDWLLIMSRQSSFAQDGTAIELRRAAQKLHAGYLLEGSVRQQHGAARIVVRLVDRASGHYLWTERYDHAIADLFRIQEDVAAKVAAAVGEQVFSAEQIRTKFMSAESHTAWETIIRALSLMNTRKKPQVAMAQALLKNAIAIDPNSALAYGLLSFTVTLGVHLGWNSRKTAQPIALGYAERALALDDENPWSHVALGYATLQVSNRPEEAIEILEYALNLNSELAIAHYFIALASAYMGKTENSFQHADMAERLRHHDLLARGNAGAHDNVRATASFVAGRYREGIAFARRAISQSPRQIPAYRQLVTNCAFAGEIDQATKALQTIKRFAPNMQQFIKESETAWSHKDHFKNYAEAFRAAGLK